MYQSYLLMKLCVKLLLMIGAVALGTLKCKMLANRGRHSYMNDCNLCVLKRGKQNVLLTIHCKIYFSQNTC